MAAQSTLFVFLQRPLMTPKGAMAKSDYDSFKAAYLTAEADLAVAEAQLKQAEAQLEVADAALIKAERNLSYCVITSPVDGIIIDRRVSVGPIISVIAAIARSLRRDVGWVIARIVRTAAAGKQEKCRNNKNQENRTSQEFSHYHLPLYLKSPVPGRKITIN